MSFNKRSIGLGAKDGIVFGPVVPIATTGSCEIPISYFFLYNATKCTHFAPMFPRRDGKVLPEDASWQDMHAFASPIRRLIRRNGRSKGSLSHQERKEMRSWKDQE